ncbi:MAG: methenyltetrahydromethanopterin cyclohydrolase, partial [Candidatus Heimdallarchaeota archaeon]|nr:methenyltetrahydromethanopterin cyclohydrolase [Candidatus Heimdallarchaeota archaeon]
MNDKSWNIIQEMITKKDELKIDVVETPVGILIDAGVKTPGSIKAGIEVAKVCMGGMGKIEQKPVEIGGAQFEGLIVIDDKTPVYSMLGSQMAGWSIKGTTLDGKKFRALGSGPARMLAKKPKELFEEIQYQEVSDHAVMVLEASKYPGEDVIRKVAERCGVDPDAVALVVLATNSIANSTQSAARIAETALHKLEVIHNSNLSFLQVTHAEGSAPIPPVHPDPMVAMGIVNDAILYGGDCLLKVKGATDEQLKDVVELIPSNSAKQYGRPFYEIFKDADFDFYKIDRGLFAPAKCTLENIESGSTVSWGEINPKAIHES